MVNDGDPAFLPGHAALDAVVCIGACELEGAFADGQSLLADPEADVFAFEVRLRNVDGSSYVAERITYTVAERAEIDSNLQLTALHGRDEKLRLRRNGTLVNLRDWLHEILSEMEPLAELLDRQQPGQPYLAALHWQQQKVRDTAMTPSARMLEEMRENDESFYEFARRKSAEHHRYFDSREIDPERLAEFRALASDSLEKQQQREAATRGSFDEFLNNYFNDNL